MAMKTVASYIVFFLSILSNHETEAIKQFTQNRIHWEEQFKRLQKPSVKTIKTEYGDLYDCVDFYKQPTFDHPLLKNHTFHPQMRPSFAPKRMKTDTPSEAKDTVLDSIKLEDGGCPTGTVPIRRVTKNEFMEIMQFTEEYTSRTKPYTNQPGSHFAIAQTKTNPSTVYNGVGGVLTLHDPSVRSSQFSAGEFIIMNGNDAIRVGWMAGQSHCFNTLCPGFISVREDIPIDVAFARVSKYGHSAVSCQFFIYQDAKNGNWWLELAPEGIIIGFWPQKIFTGLAHSASYIAVGGQVYGPPDQPLPQMGNGRYPVEDITLSAYCRDFIVVDANYKQIDTQDTEEYRDDKHYAVYDHGYEEGLGRLVFYGGPW
ncbi:hypothetical protein Cgig2_030888 [Carnegiea gigantea]|uniref:Neprosin PEP catalytic domain-containing protein n=1 Tax=Carnegiea gigantea TaxID=171969 RepID=A0A9Q1KGI3_9CARY|nr:hypothetical protein Cgig2_030888 [Carnegiea gigantea]